MCSGSDGIAKDRLCGKHLCSLLKALSPYTAFGGAAAKVLRCVISFHDSPQERIEVRFIWAWIDDVDENFPERRPDFGFCHEWKVIESRAHNFGLEFAVNVGAELQQLVVPVQIFNPHNLGIDMNL
jgi:hypothetical protein